MRKSKKGYALPTAIVVTAVLLIIAAAFVSVTYNNLNATSRDLSSRQAYINAKSALIYTTAYYKSNPTNIPAESTTHYMIMNADNGSTTEGAERRLAFTSDITKSACYVEITNVGAGKLELTAYARYGSSLGGTTSVRELSTDLTIDVDNNTSGSGYEVNVPPPTYNYDDLELIYDIVSDENADCSIYVKRNENAKYLPYVYTWAYSPVSGTDYTREIDAISDNSYWWNKSTELNPSGVWRHGGDGKGVDASAVTELQTSGNYKGYYGLNLTGGQMMVKYYGTDPSMLAWYSSKGDNHYSSSYATSNKRINFVNAIITLEGADNGYDQSNEMFDIPTTRGAIFIDTLTAELNYYDKGAANTLNENSNDGKLDVYTQNIMVHIKLDGWNNEWSTKPSISATRYNSEQVAELREQNSIMDSVDPLTGGSYATMIYEGNGWYRYSIPTSANFTANIKGTANGKNINLSNEYVKCSNGYDYYFLVKGSGDTLTSAVSTEKRPSSDNSVSIHVKVPDSIKGSNDVQIITSTSTSDAVEIRYIDDDGTLIETAAAYLNNRINTSDGTSFSKPGYIISGWVLDSGTIAGTEFALGTSIKIDDSYCQLDTSGVKYMALRPVWSEVSSKLQIDFYNDGKKIESMSDIEYNSSVMFSALPDDDIRYFKHWSTADDGSGTIYKAGINYKITASMKLYAQWENYLSVTFSANGGELDSSSSDFIGKMKAGDSFTTAKAPTREGYTFLYWSTSPSSAGTHYNAEETVKISASMTLYAVWKSDTSSPVYFEAPTGWTNNTIYVNGGKGNIAMERIDNTNIYTAEVDGDTTSLTFSSGTTVYSNSATFGENIVYRVKGYDEYKNAIIDSTKTFTGAYYVDGYVVYMQNDTENYLTENFNVYAWKDSDKTFKAKNEISANKIDGTNLSTVFVPKEYSTYNVVLANTNKIFAATDSGIEPYYNVSGSDWPKMTHINMLNGRIYYAVGTSTITANMKNYSTEKGKLHSVWSDYDEGESGYIYYYSSANYVPKAYMWGSDAGINVTDFNDSPVMEDTGKTVDGKKVYRIKATNSEGIYYENVIFFNKDNSSEKTNDLAIVDGKITSDSLSSNTLGQKSTLLLIDTRNLSDAYDMSTHKNNNYVYLSDEKVEVRSSASLVYTISESLIAGDSNIIYSSVTPESTSSIIAEPDATLAETSTGTTYTMVAEDTRIYYKNKMITSDRYDSYGQDTMAGNFGMRGRRRGDSREVDDTWYVYNISSPSISKFKIKVGSSETAEIQNTGSDMYIVLGEEIYVRSDPASKVPSAYMWNDGGSSNASWPGVTMTPVEGEEHTFKISVTGYKNVIFSVLSGTNKSGDMVIADHIGQLYHMNSGKWEAHTSSSLGVTAYTSNPDNMLTKTTRVYYNSASGAPTLKYKSIVDTEYTEVTMNKVTDDTSYPNLYYYDVPNDKVQLRFNGSSVEQILPTNGSGTYWTGSSWTTYTSPEDALTESLNAFIAAYRKFTIEEYEASESSSALDLRVTGKYNAKTETIDGETFAKLSRFSAFKNGSNIVNYINDNKASWSGGTKRNVSKVLDELTASAKALVEKVYTARCYIPAYDMGAGVDAISDDETIVKLNKAVIDTVSSYASIGNTCNSTPSSYSDLTSKLSTAKSSLVALKDKIALFLNSEVNEIDKSKMFAVIIPSTVDGYAITDVKIHYKDGDVVKTNNLTSIESGYYYYWLKQGFTEVYFTYTYKLASEIGEKKSDFVGGEQYIYDIEKKIWKPNSAIKTINVSTSFIKQTDAGTYTFDFEEDEEIFYINFEKDCKIVFTNASGSDQTEIIYAGKYYMYKSQWTQGSTVESVVIPSSKFYYIIRAQMYDVANDISVKMAETVKWFADDSGTVQAITSTSSELDYNKLASGKTINFFVPATDKNLYILRSATSDPSQTGTGSIYSAYAINFKWYNTDGSAARDMEFISNNSLTLNASTVSIGTNASLKRNSSSAHFLVGDGASDSTIVVKILNDIIITTESGSFIVEQGIYTIKPDDRTASGASFVENRFDIFSSKAAWQYLNKNCRESTSYIIGGGI